MFDPMTAVAISSLVGGGLGLLGANQQADASKQAAQTQAGASQQGIDLQRQMYLSNLALNAPWRASGQAALTRMNQLMGLSPAIMSSADLNNLGQFASKSPSANLPMIPTPNGLVPMGTPQGVGEPLAGYTPPPGIRTNPPGSSPLPPNAIQHIANFFKGGSSQLSKVGAYTKWLRDNNLPMGTDPKNYGHTGTGPLPNLGLNTAKPFDLGDPQLAALKAARGQSTGMGADIVGDRSGKQSSTLGSLSSMEGQMGGSVPGAFDEQQQLTALRQTEAQNPSDFGMLNRSFQYVPNQDPSYQFRLQQGMDALQKSAAAKGGFFSGQTGKDLTEYSQGLASQEYQNAYARQRAEEEAMYNRLAGLAGTGQTAATQAGNWGMQSTQDIASMLGNIGQAQAGGQLGSAQAWNSGMQNLGNQLTSGIGQYLNYNMFNNKNGGGSNWNTAAPGSVWQQG